MWLNSTEENGNEYLTLITEIFSCIFHDYQKTNRAEWGNRGEEKYRIFRVQNPRAERERAREVWKFICIFFPYISRPKILK